MKGRNLYFASVFCKELDNWKRETKKTQADFANATGIHPNMISRYKKGDAFPTSPVIEVISKTLGVNQSIFFPQTPIEKAAFDEEYRLNLISELTEIEIEIIKTFGINLAFWAFFMSVEHIYDLFPFEVAPADEWRSDMIFGKKNSSGKCVGFTKKDLHLVKYYQSETKTLITLLSMKELLNKESTDTQKE